MIFNEYDKYQLQWLIDHKHSLSSLIKSISDYAGELDCEGLSIVDIFNLWENDCGFGSEIYVCSDEFYDNEFLLDDDEYTFTVTK